MVELPGHRKCLGGFIRITDPSRAFLVTEIIPTGTLGLRIESIVMRMGPLALVGLMRHHDRDQEPSRRELELVKALAIRLGVEVVGIEAWDWKRRLRLVAIGVVVVMAAATAAALYFPP